MSLGNSHKISFYQDGHNYLDLLFNLFKLDQEAREHQLKVLKTFFSSNKILLALGTEIKDNLPKDLKPLEFRQYLIRIIFPFLLNLLKRTYKNNPSSARNKMTITTCLDLLSEFMHFLYHLDLASEKRKTSVRSPVKATSSSSNKRPELLFTTNLLQCNLGNGIKLPVPITTYFLAQFSRTDIDIIPDLPQLRELANWLLATFDKHYKNDADTVITTFRNLVFLKASREALSNFWFKYEAHINDSLVCGILNEAIDLEAQIPSDYSQKVQNNLLAPIVQVFLTAILDLCSRAYDGELYDGAENKERIINHLRGLIDDVSTISLTNIRNTAQHFLGHYEVYLAHDPYLQLVLTILANPHLSTLLATQGFIRGIYHFIQTTVNKFKEDFNTERAAERLAPLTDFFKNYEGADLSAELLLKGHFECLSKKIFPCNTFYISTPIFHWNYLIQVIDLHYQFEGTKIPSGYSLNLNAFLEFLKLMGVCPQESTVDDIRKYLMHQGRISTPVPDGKGAVLQKNGHELLSIKINYEVLVPDLLQAIFTRPSSLQLVRDTLQAIRHIPQMRPEQAFALNIYECNFSLAEYGDKKFNLLTCAALRATESEYAHLRSICHHLKLINAEQFPKLIITTLKDIIALNQPLAWKFFQKEYLQEDKNPELVAAFEKEIVRMLKEESMSAGGPVTFLFLTQHAPQYLTKELLEDVAKKAASVSNDKSAEVNARAAANSISRLDFMQERRSTLFNLFAILKDDEIARELIAQLHAFNDHGANTDYIRAYAAKRLTALKESAIKVHIGIPLLLSILASPYQENLLAAHGLIEQIGTLVKGDIDGANPAASRYLVTLANFISDQYKGSNLIVELLSSGHLSLFTSWGLSLNAFHDYLLRYPDAYYSAEGESIPLARNTGAIMNIPSSDLWFFLQLLGVCAPLGSLEDIKKYLLHDGDYSSLIVDSDGNPICTSAGHFIYAKKFKYDVLIPDLIQAILIRKLPLQLLHDAVYTVQEVLKSKRDKFSHFDIYTAEFKILDRSEIKYSFLTCAALGLADYPQDKVCLQNICQMLAQMDPDKFSNAVLKTVQDLKALSALKKGALPEPLAQALPIILHFFTSGEYALLKDALQPQYITPSIQDSIYRLRSDASEIPADAAAKAEALASLSTSASTNVARGIVTAAVEDIVDEITPSMPPSNTATMRAEKPTPPPPPPKEIEMPMITIPMSAQAPQLLSTNKSVPQPDKVMEQEPAPASVSTDNDAMASIAEQEPAPSAAAPSTASTDPVSIDREELLKKFGLASIKQDPKNDVQALLLQILHHSFSEQLLLTPGFKDWLIRLTQLDLSNERNLFLIFSLQEFIRRYKGGSVATALFRSCHFDLFKNSLLALDTFQYVTDNVTRNCLEEFATHRFLTPYTSDLGISPDSPGSLVLPHMSMSESDRLVLLQIKDFLSIFGLRLNAKFFNRPRLIQPTKNTESASLKQAMNASIFLQHITRVLLDDRQQKFPRKLLLQALKELASTTLISVESGTGFVFSALPVPLPHAAHHACSIVSYAALKLRDDAPLSPERKDLELVCTKLAGRPEFADLVKEAFYDAVSYGNFFALKYFVEHETYKTYLTPYIIRKAVDFCSNSVYLLPADRKRMARYLNSVKINPSLAQSTIFLDHSQGATASAGAGSSQLTHFGEIPVDEDPLALGPTL